MKINVDRLCELAGVGQPRRSRRSGMLSEASNRSLHDDPFYKDEINFRYGAAGQLSEQADDENLEVVDGDTSEANDPWAEVSEYGSEVEESLGGTYGGVRTEPAGLFEDDPEGEGSDENTVYEIDEADLVAELRRARRMVNEARSNRRRKMYEQSELDRIIGEEVSNVMSSLNLNSQWVYGKNKPTFSKSGRVTTSFPGVGFGKKKW